MDNKNNIQQLENQAQSILFLNYWRGMKYLYEMTFRRKEMNRLLLRHGGRAKICQDEGKDSHFPILEEHTEQDD
jgi:hypothetical protein